jgi:acyl dehydratase
MASPDLLNVSNKMRFAMPLHADIVGRQLPEQVMHVTPRMALAYAAAIADENAVCTDDAHPGFIAHPAFCVTPEWRLVIENRARGMGLTPDETLRGVHAGQNTEFHAPIRPGIEIRITGEVLDVRGTRAGALVRTRLAIGDAVSGESLSSTLTTALYRGVAVEGAGSEVSPVDDVTDRWQPAPDWKSVTVPLDRLFAHRYSECADIWNPIHTERRVARAAGLPDIIVHGTALWALAGRELIAAYAAGAPERLASLNGRFSAMVLAGEPITVRHGRGLGREIVFTVLNAAGEAAISKGIATFR